METGVAYGMVKANASGATESKPFCLPGFEDKKCRFCNEDGFVLLCRLVEKKPVTYGEFVCGQCSVKYNYDGSLNAETYEEEPTSSDDELDALPFNSDGEFDADEYNSNR